MKNQFNDEVIPVNISSLIDFYKTLPSDEQPEQIADWAAYSTLAFLKNDERLKNDFAEDKLPMRLKNFRNSGFLFYNPGRLLKLNKNEYIAVLPGNNSRWESVLIRLLDENRKNDGFLNSTVHVIYFDYENNSSTISLRYHSSNKISEYFNEKKGYFSKPIRNINDFNDWFSNIDDLTFFKQEPTGVIILGGRRVIDDRKENISSEDISAIYKAYNNSSFRSDKPLNFKAMKNQQYEAYINYLLSEMLEKNERLKLGIKNGTINRADVIDFIKEEIPIDAFDIDERPNVGFSLDPSLNYEGFANDINDMINPINAQGKFPPNINNLISEYSDTLRKIAESLRMHTTNKYLIFRRQLEEMHADGVLILKKFLESLEFKNSYQRARYDGNIKGTELAMILFYTDLTAKIWAIDYEGTTPQKYITGFIPLTQIKVPKLYWEKFLKLSNTRLWFGVKSEGYEITSDKKTIFFEPVATRIYSASSNPLYPGKETEHNYQSAEFLEWWDRHYTLVADYEPEYHKLNQVQKWSILFNLARNINKNLFSFLGDVKTDNSLNFASWYQKNNKLKCKVSLPFLIGQKYNSKNECLARLSSKNYYIMGQSFFLYGGVSLASDKEFLFKALQKKRFKIRNIGKKFPGIKKPEIKTSKEIPVKARHKRFSIKELFSKLKSKVKEIIRGDKQAKEKEEVQVSEEQVKTVYEKDKNEFRGNTLKITETKLSPDISSSNKLVKIDIELSDTKYGSILAEKEKNKIVLDWTDNQGGFFQKVIDKLIQVENTISNANEPDLTNKIISSNNFVSRTFCIEKNKKYLVELKNKSFRYAIIGINDQLKKEGYAVQSSGTEVFSNIYGMRLAKSDEIKQYIQ